MIDLAMKAPPIVSPAEWEAAREQLLVKLPRDAVQGHAMHHDFMIRFHLG